MHYEDTHKHGSCKKIESAKLIFHDYAKDLIYITNYDCKPLEQYFQLCFLFFTLNSLEKDVIDKIFLISPLSIFIHHLAS